MPLRDSDDFLQSTHFRVVTLNIRHGADEHGAIYLEALGKSLSDIMPAAICFQEVDVCPGRSGKADQAELLATYSHTVSTFSPTIRYQKVFMVLQYSPEANHYR